MNEKKKKAICEIINASVINFVAGLETRYEDEVDDPNGVINSKKNNCFIAELGEEFMFYSAFFIFDFYIYAINKHEGVQRF